MDMPGTPFLVSRIAPRLHFEIQHRIHEILHELRDIEPVRLLCIALEHELIRISARICQILFALFGK